MSSGRIARGRVVLAVLVLGALGFGLSALPWASAEVPTVLGNQPVSVSGGEASPATTATSLAILATALAVAIGGRWVTRLCAGVLVVLGAALAAASLTFLLDPAPRLHTAAAQVSGVREIVGEPALTPWPFVTVALALVVVAAALPTLRIPPATAGRRFERPDGAATAPPPTRPARDERVRAMDDWDALGRGEDPTDADHR